MAPIRAFPAGGDDGAHGGPLRLFAAWRTAAVEAGLTEPDAMALATVDPDGRPSCRMVLLRGFGDRGLVFYTNLESRKARALAHRPAAAVTFWWPALERQVRVEGHIVRVDDEEANAYFASRPRGSQLSAWASPQSRSIRDRAELDDGIARAAARFDGSAVPRPPFWSGFRLVPDAWEFWQGRPDRAHDRLRFELDDSDWSGRLLAP